VSQNTSSFAYWLYPLNIFCFLDEFIFLDIGSDINIALNKAATQSSTIFYANRAVDGNRSSNYSQRSCSHTSPESSSPPWWRVDVGNVVRRTKVWSLSLPPEIKRLLLLPSEAPALIYSLFNIITNSKQL
jgi:hypothetical protein